jgi:hypothetical protein
MRKESRASRANQIIIYLAILTVGGIGAGAVARNAKQWLAYPPHEPKAGDSFPSCGLFISATGGNPIGKGQGFEEGGRQFVDESIVYSSWAHGFITGINFSQASPDKQIDTDFAAIDLWLRNYCLQHPTKSFLEAVAMFSNANLKAR